MINVNRQENNTAKEKYILVSLCAVKEINFATSTPASNSKCLRFKFQRSYIMTTLAIYWLDG
jgi:hypothetical protein